MNKSTIQLSAPGHIHDILDQIANRYMDKTGSEICLALTTAVDSVLIDAGEEFADRVAVFAIGGYGRRELCRYSDIDLFIMYAPKDKGEIEPWLRDFLHPLWDARLEIKYSAHTVEEAEVVWQLPIGGAIAVVDSALFQGR